MIRASDIEGKKVRGPDGKSAGVVFELHVVDGLLETLICGQRGFWQRLTAARGGHRIKWSAVKRITASEILVE